MGHSSFMGIDSEMGEGEGGGLILDFTSPSLHRVVFSGGQWWRLGPIQTQSEAFLRGLLRGVRGTLDNDPLMFSS